MRYIDYQNARDATWKLLIDQNIKKLPIQIGAVCKTLGITIKLYVPADENDGKSLIVENVPTIMVSSKIRLPRQRFTAAHELGVVAK